MRGRSLLVTSILVLGCAPSASQKVERDMASVRRESDPKLLVARGKAFATVGDYTRAEEYLAAALDAGASPREVLPLLIDVCVRTGRYRSAIQHGENHLRRYPNDARTRLMVGALYAAINDGKQARAQLERALGASDGPQERAGEPTSARDGKAAPRSREEREGREELQAQAHYLLGIVARDSENDPVEADHQFREYLRIEPEGSHSEEAKASLLKRVP